MSLFSKKNVTVKSKVTITPLDKNQLNTIVGGSAGQPIGGIIVKGGKGIQENGIK
jgi:hypothetical protein